MGTAELSRKPDGEMLGGNLTMDKHPIQGQSHTPSRLMLRKPG